MLLSMLAAAATGASGAYVFDDPTYLGDATEWGAWADMLQRYAPEHAVLRACREHEDSCPKRHKGLHIILQRGADLELHKKLQLVNRYVNRKGYRVDRHTRVQAHRSSKRSINQWSTPLEFFKRGGDCEDFASTKYFLLRELGVAADDLRIVVAFDREYREHHAVVAVRRDAERSFLLEIDNKVLRRKPTAFRYVYAVNEKSVWDHE